jgi:Transcriptional regulators
MTAACRDAGLDEPTFEELGTRFRVTLSGTRQHSPVLDSLDQAIISTLADSGGLSTHAIATAIGRSPRATRTRLATLVERGVIVEIGSGPNDPRRRYHLAQP